MPGGKALAPISVSHSAAKGQPDTTGPNTSETSPKPLYIDAEVATPHALSRGKVGLVDERDP